MLGGLGLVLVVLTTPCPTAAAASPSVGVGVSLSADVLSGTAPLLVEFTASLTPNTTIGEFQWTFGDGATYDGNATGISSVYHEYLTPGRYATNVVVRTGGLAPNASVLVTVLPTALAVAINATPTTGPPPLTTRFTALVSGGTGSYRSFEWDFGDGDRGSGTSLAYTFERAGTYYVSLNVTDTQGNAALAVVSVHVGSGTGAAPSDPWFGGATLAAYGIAAVLAVLAVVAYAFRAIVTRRARSGPPPAGAVSPPQLARPIERGAVAPSAPPPEPEAAESVLIASRRLSERLLVHLYWHGRPGPGGIASAEASQAGMARRLDARQNTLSKALQRLLAAGLVRADLEHVPGASRRVKTYSLTPRGEALARRLAREKDPSP